MDSMKKILLSLFLALATFPLLAQQTLSPELLWKIGRISDEQVSPNGRQILFGETY